MGKRIENEILGTMKFCLLYMYVYISDIFLNSVVYITKISCLGEIPTVDPVSGVFRPQYGFLSFEKVTKKK